MARELTTSREREERLARLRRFLAPQVAELVEKAGDEGVLLGQRVEVVVVFCDLRGFTAFSTEAEPEEVMQLLADYYQTLGTIVTRFEATVTSISADGLMVLVNAPVPSAEPEANDMHRPAIASMIESGTIPASQRQVFGLHGMIGSESSHRT